jgi:hypothetical protein
MQVSEFVTPTIETIRGEVKTLRDEFAMAALPALIEKSKTADDIISTPELAYAYADAMLKARAE